MPYHQSAAQSSESGTNSSIQLQTIHSRYVSDPKKLSKLLKEHYGPGNYTVEMRHNVYHIQASGYLRLADIERRCY